MKSFSPFAGLLAILATTSATPLLQDRAVCNADNCARVVTGTRAGLPSTRQADCSSFMQVTVTPAPVYTTLTITPVVTDVSTITTNPVFVYTTITTTVTVISRPTSFAPVSAREVAYPRAAGAGSGVTTPITASPTAVPSYAASVCPASRYSSACSCAGIAATTTILPASTTTVTQHAPTITAEVYTAATTTIQRTAVATVTGAVKTGYPCNRNVQGNGIYSFRSYRVNCGQRVTSGQVGYSANSGQESDCLRLCNSIKYCVYAEYRFSDGTCDLYYSSPTAIVDDDNVDALILN